MLSPDVRTAALSEDLPAGDVVVDGEPRARLAELLDTEHGGIGLWEMTAGVAEDTETDELFLVLEGSGTVSFEDGESIRLEPGVLVRLTRGERATWSVQDQLRKLYVSL
ncbi:cupin domain-containing protein [Nocardioides mesophilus]|uniref:Cupin domain-containing protein n=1 Tax=Nocardioides mesophilus TaxID=433659 RepID=A0A7G9RHN4_9ACTN|nr:cupin domain-containing protein [Nocardioides mesophilus]